MSPGALGRAARAASGAAGAVKDAVVGSARATEQAAAEVKDKAEAVGETAERARFAPGIIAAEVKQGIRDVAPEVVKTTVAGALVLVLVATAYIVFAVSLVAVLNHAIGDPWGTVAAWVVLTLAAVGGVLWARASLGEAKEETQETAAQVEAEADFVTAPVRREFGDAGGPA